MCDESIVELNIVSNIVERQLLGGNGALLLRQPVGFGVNSISRHYKTFRKKSYKTAKSSPFLTVMIPDNVVYKQTR